MSPREKLQSELFDWLEMRSKSQFTAPYGVLASLEPVVGDNRLARPGSKPNKGKVRVITFGKARTLDATIYIFSEKDIRVKAAGPLAFELDGRRFTNVEDLKTVLETL
jgi:hypothetical protein